MIASAGADATPDPSLLLRVRNLRTSFGKDERRTFAVDDISFDIARGETVCIVGESGSGKSVTALSIMGLIAAPGRVEAEALRFEEVEISALSAVARRDLRGDRMGMIFQEPMTSLNPALTIGVQLAESLIHHRGMTAAAARARAIALLRQVRIPAPEQRVDQYPHQLSGGMRQRVMIAIAIACQPSLLIADEPTTALDVTIQAQILDVLRALRDEIGTAILFITHDLGIVAEIADRILVMYAGRIVESGNAAAIFEDPQHPYTLGLLSSIPSLAGDSDRLFTIEGAVPPPHAMPKGCRFHPRCVFADQICVDQSPPFFEFGVGHVAACWHAPVEQHG